MADKETKKRSFPFHIVKRTDMPQWKAWLIRIGSIVIGLLIACVLLWFTSKANPIRVFEEMGAGCFGTPRRTWIFFRDLAMLLGVGLALIPAFKMKFWNLGGNGQILMGDLAAMMCMFYMGQAGCPDWLIILAMIPSAILAGIIWAVIPAIFKAIFNTNESLFTLMMNYLASGLVATFLSAAITSGSGQMPIQKHGNFVVLFGNANILPIIVVACVLVFIYSYLRFNKHGYELEVVGESSNTARYIGINVKKVIIRTMVLSGAICGLIGLLYAGALDHTITTTSARDLGFTAIMVAWLGKFNPLIMVGTSFVVTFLDNGMSQVQTTFGIQSDAIGYIVIGIVYFALIGSEFFVSYRIMHSQRKIDTFKNQKKWTHLLTDGLLNEEAR